jgi:PAS domain S-box-containing protein
VYLTDFLLETNDVLMSNDSNSNPDEQKATSKKDTVLYGRVTKKKFKDKVRYSEKIYRHEYDYKQTFKSAFDFSGIGMALVSPEGNILDVNNAFCNFIGYTKPELLEFNFLELGHPDDNENDNTLLNRMLTNVLNYYSLEKRYISKKNTILWGMHTVSKVCNDNGTLEFYVLQVVDITHRKTLTDELNRKNSELEAIRTGLINRINQLEELNNIIAHNLRGPANNVSLLIGMLKDSVDEKDAPGSRLEMTDIVNYLEEGSNSLLNSLNTLMEVVQISMSKDIPFEVCDVYEIVHEILDQLNSTIFETGAFVQFDMGVPKISYPKVFFESIIYNLLSNSLKYISPDRIPDILIKTYEEDGKIKISVKDNGLGIDLVKYGSKIFKLNQVFHKHPNSKGVGLYITKAQVESFGGTITVKSRENEGSEFIVTL